MTAMNPNYAASPLAPLVDESRLGSVGGQVTTGIAGIVLAIVLIVGQISLATTKGIAAHVHATVENVTEANVVLESVVERAAPASMLDEVLGGQAKTLANTHATMQANNVELEKIAATKAELAKIVDQMAGTSGQLATGVAGMDSTTVGITTKLGGLPGATQRTHVQLSRINRDTKAINGELSAIAKKMLNYGLPPAIGAPTGGERR